MLCRFFKKNCRCCGVILFFRQMYHFSVCFMSRCVFLGVAITVHMHVSL